MTQSEDGIDFKFKPVYHIVARSREVTDFEFHSFFERLKKRNQTMNPIHTYLTGPDLLRGIAYTGPVRQFTLANC